MEKNVIICDGCKADLSDGGPRPGYYLTLSCDNLPTTSSRMYCLAVFPPINHTMHFCGTGCLIQKFNPSKPD